MNLARRSVGFACLALCIFSIGAAVIGGETSLMSPFSLLFSIVALVTGLCAAISLRP